MLDVNPARLATMAILFCNGLLYATWGVSVPVVKEKIGLSEGVLSLAMAAVAIGGIATMAAAGRWIARVGSGTASVRSGILMALSAGPILLMGDFGGLLVLLFIYGMATAANDVAANAQVAHLEQISKRSLIGSVHGSFSAGGLAGALLASAWAAGNVTPALNFICVAMPCLLAMVLAARFLRNDPLTHREAEEAPSGAHPGLDKEARRRLRTLGALAFSALVIEGAFYDWAAVYMRDIAHANAGWVGFGYAAFAIAMAMGRMGGDWVRDRYSHQAVIATSGGLSLAGLTVVLSNISPTGVIAGFFITGVGLSNVIPVLFSTAGKLAHEAGWAASQGLATTTRIAYVGLLAGPLVIGPVAEMVGLRLAMVTLMAAISATCGGWLLLSKRTDGSPWMLPRQRHVHPSCNRLSNSK